MPGLDQDATPYLDALIAYADRDPGRFHVPGHKGGPGADPALREAIGEAALRLDIPAGIEGIDVGPDPAQTPFALAQRLAAEAWGARRSWFLVNGAPAATTRSASRSPTAASASSSSETSTRRSSTG